MAADFELWFAAVQNAQRFADDAELLIENERGESAVILSVLAIEEFRKALITKWGVRNEDTKRDFPSHLEKQAATFALLHAEEVANASRKKAEKYRKQNDFRIFGPHSEQFS